MQAHTSRTLYFVMAAWLLIGPALRIAWFVQHGSLPDYLPIVSIVIGLGSLVWALRPVKSTPGPRRVPTTPRT